MKIGLDYDGTVSEDVDLFKMLVPIIKACGHEVYIVTMRYESEINHDKHPMNPDLLKLVNGVICTRRQAKKPHCLAMGLKIDVWIDDNAEAITKSAVEIWGWCTPEGEVYVANHSKGDSLEAPRPTGGFVDCPDGPVLGPLLELSFPNGKPMANDWNDN